MNQDPSTPTEGPWAADIDCLLTLAMPLALEEEMLDLLRQHADLVPGFSVIQGHARRVFVHMVMRSGDVAPLVARLREVLQSPQVFYWTVPLQTFGRLA